MIAVIDESTPRLGANGYVLYGIAVAVLDEIDADMVRVQLQDCLHRKRPLHWEQEGPDTKRRFVERVTELPVRFHVASTAAAAAEQQVARSRLLHERLLPLCSQDGVDSYLIEQRSKAEDERDRRDIRDWSRVAGHRFPNLVHVAKSEPLAWLSDAVAGVWTDAVLGRGDGALRSLFAAGAIESCEHTLIGS